MHPANSADRSRPTRRLTFLALALAAALVQRDGLAQTLPTPPSGFGNAFPSLVTAGEPVLLTVDVFPGENPPSTGLAVRADLSAIGGSASQAFFDDGSNGDPVEDDNSFSFQAVVAITTPGNTYMLPATITDAEAREGSAVIFLTVDPATVPLAIHDIQGSGAASPHVGLRVQTSGIVTGLRPSFFYIQAPDVQADSDPNTSEGILVFRPGLPPAAVGDVVDVTGIVTEFTSNQQTMTALSGFPSVTVLSTGEPLPTPVTLTAADTPSTGGLDVLERFEGMRVHVPALRVVAPTGASNINELNGTSLSNGIFYGVIDGLARPFREAGLDPFVPPPAGLPLNVPQFDGNPERIRVDSDAQVGALRIEVAAGQVVADLVGPLDYESNAYTIVPDPLPAPGYAVAGPQAAVPVSAPSAHQFTVASLNLQRLFDMTNDPAIAEPVVQPLAFANRLNKLSLLVRNVLQSPDIIGVAEVENLVTLQALANKINTDLASPDLYQAVLVETDDVGPGLPLERGLDVGFLVKSSRVTVVGVTQEGPDVTYLDPVTGTQILNDRPPLVLRAEISTPSGGTFPITVVANHLTDPVNNPSVRLKRKLQAEFLANLVQARQTADPSERIVVLGDFNAFQFNDGLVDVVGTVKGTPAPADQVLEASADLVDPDLVDVGDTVPASDRYSFVFDGNAQQLDHILFTQNLQASFAGLQYGRVNADFPESFRGTPSRPERISDHDPLVAYFSFPAVATIGDVTLTEGNAGQTLAAFTVSVDNGTGGNVIVGYATADGSGPDAAVAGQDYVAQSGSLIFGPGLSQQTINVAVLGDTRFENNESFVVNLLTQGGQPGLVLGDAQGTGTILNDDAQPSLSINDVTVVEGNTGSTTVSFTVSLGASSGLTTTVEFSTADGTATQPSDYQAASGLISFAPGETTRTVPVTVVGDVLDEPAETFQVNLANATNASIADPQGIGTITNDDAPAAQGFSISDVVVHEPHGGHKFALFRVSLSAPAASLTSVRFSTLDGTARAGFDYKQTAGTLVFKPGDRFRTVQVKVLADRIDEGDESFAVQLSNPVNASIVDGTGIGTIRDSDNRPWIRIRNAHGREPATGTTPLTFKLRLSHPSTQPVTVRFRTANGSAHAGQDYISRDITVTFAPLETSKSVDVSVLADGRREPVEVFFGKLSEAVNGKIADGVALGVIGDARHHKDRK